MSQSFDLQGSEAIAARDVMPVSPQHRVLSFGGMVFDPQNLELTRDGERVMLQPLPGRMLVVLIRNRGRIVSKEELRSILWPNTFVSDSAISSTLRDLRRAVKDEGQHQKIVRTYRGRGYRFAAELDDVEDAADLDLVPQHSSSVALSAVEADASVAAPFVGRILELEKLDRCLRKVSSKCQGSFVLIEGSLGTGKTALLDQFSRQVSGAIVVRQRCRSEHWKPPMQMLAEMLAGLIDVLARNEERGWLDPKALPLAHPEERILDLGGESAEELAQVLSFASQTRPVIILIDDLHFADERSATHLLGLVEFLDSKGILIVATAELGLLSATALAALDQLDADSRLALSGLSLSHVECLAETLMARPPDTTWLRSLHYNTDGCPGPTVELLRCAARLEPNPPSVAELPLPEPLAGMLRGRLEQLPTETRHLVIASTSLPPEADLATLARVAGLEKVEQRALEPAILGGWFLPGGWTHQVRIRSPFLRRVVLSAISAERRRQIDWRALRADSDLAADHEQGNVFFLEPNLSPALPNNDSQGSPTNTEDKSK